jgi:hypothetical protein
MLDIIVLLVLTKSIGRIAANKGHSKTHYQILLVALWFGGELLGFILGMVFGSHFSDDEDAGLLIGAACGIGCAILGAVTAFLIAKNLEPATAEDEFFRRADYGETWRERERSQDEPERPQRPTDDRIQD